MLFLTLLRKRRLEGIFSGSAGIRYWAEPKVVHGLLVINAARDRCRGLNPCARHPGGLLQDLFCRMWLVSILIRSW
jgi:hypothetical protein